MSLAELRRTAAKPEPTNLSAESQVNHYLAAIDPAPRTPRKAPPIATRLPAHAPRDHARRRATCRGACSSGAHQQGAQADIRRGD